MFCRRCGKEMPDGATYCPSCGEPQSGSPTAQQPNYQQSMVYDSGSFGWAILGFLIPIVGLILWLAWMDVKPKSGKMAGLGALTAVIFSIVLWIVIIAIILILGPDTTTADSIISML